MLATLSPDRRRRSIQEAAIMKTTQLLSKVRQLLLAVVPAIILSFSSTPVVFADALTECTPPTASTPGVHVPTGSDAAMFEYDCTQQVWVSAHYIYDPLSGTTTPLDPTIYTYNTTTSQWDYDTWVYVASKSNYVLRTFSVADPPAGATTIGGPVAPDTTTAQVPVDQSTASSDDNTKTIADASGNTATAIAVANSVGSVAISGDATVAMNTTAGSASTGNATALATLVNMLQSSGNVFGAAGNAVVFNTTISGNVTGDILLDPSLIGSIQPSSSPASTLTDVNGVTHSTTATTITNDLSLGATTGDALVAANTQAGDATSGNATAVANVLNFLSSTVVSGKSFLGIINIDGNFNGDILLPANFIDQLLVSNVPTLSIAVPAGSNGALDTSVSQSITNAVSATATSGNAAVDKNTTAGNATTGSATTNITTFNLTGNTVIGKNALLVFVNTLGTWYGLIFNAPAGATAATLGGNITTASAIAPQIVGQYDTNQSINNTIIASAQSGDATVTKNTTAGNAKTGDAKVAVNILNIASSALSLSDWFGILFINVFGSWTGSFGVDTLAGTIIPQDSGSPASSGIASDTPLSTHTQPALFKFIPRSVSSATLFGDSTTSSANSESPTTLSGGSVLAAQHITPGTKNNAGSGQNQKKVYWIYAAFIGIWVILIAAERIYAKLRNHA